MTLLFIWTAVIFGALGFIAGATFRQYRPVKKPTGCLICNHPGAQWGYMYGGMVGGYQPLAAPESARSGPPAPPGAE